VQQHEPSTQAVSDMNVRKSLFFNIMNFLPVWVLRDVIHSINTEGEFIPSVQSVSDLQVFINLDS
jgi:hypothetical protein